MATPHNSAQKGDVASTVIMAGDPLRVKFMAENFLENPVQFNTVRNMFGYTGTYKGKRVSVMGHGMGIPSIAIYCYELFNFYDVKQIIRTGTCGSIQKGMEIGDVVIAQGACTDSNFLTQFNLPGPYSCIASYDLLEGAVQKCKELGYTHWVGNVVSSDIFYDEGENWRKWQKMGILAIEMESTALYAYAARFRKKALTILTVSDSIVEKQETTPEQRQTAFTKMMDVAFSLA